MSTRTDELKIGIESLRGLSPEARIALVRAAPDPDALLRGLSDELRALMLGDLAGAIESSDWIVALADATGSPGARLGARTAASTALAYANRFDQAMTHLDEAARLAQGMNDVAALARIALTRVQPLARMGRLQEAVETAEAAVELAEQGGDAPLAAKAHSNLGVIHRMRDDPVAALSHFDRALRVLQSDRVARAQIQSNRAEALLELAEFARAEDAFGDAHVAFAEAGMARAAAIAEGNLADLLGRQGRFQAALARFEHAREVMERGESPGDAARLLAERAEVLLEVGVVDEACRGLRRALAGLDAHALPREATRACVALGRGLAQAGRFDDALAVLHDAEQRARSLGMSQAPNRVAVARAGVLNRAARFDEALEALAASEPDTGALPIDRALRELARSEALLGLGRAQEADACAEAADALAQQAGIEALRVTALCLRGRAAAARGDRAVATERLEAAARIVERLRGALGGDRFRAAWHGGHAGVYEELVSLAVDDREIGSGDRVIELVERSRSRALLDMLHSGVELAEQVVSAGTGSPGEQRLIETLGRLKAELNAVFSAMSARMTDETARAVRTGMSERARTLSDEIGEVEGRLASTRRFSALYAEAPRADALRARLSPGAILVEYFEARGATWCAVVAPGRETTVTRLAETCVVRDAVERTAFQIARGVAMPDHAGPRGERLAEAARRELQRAHSLLLAPIHAELAAARTLVIAPCGDLFRLPFHALYDGERWLVDQACVAIVPSAGVLCAIEPASSGAHAVGLVMGFADEAAPQIEQEAQEVANLVGDADLRTGASATAENFLRMASGRGWIHIAAHGVSPAGDPLGARLRFADRWLTAREVFSLDLQGCDVTLSSCDAGRSTVRGGDELFGFIRAFLAAGARSLVTSLWAAHDARTRELMTGLYRAMGQTGTSRCAAFNHAQRSLAQRTPHPAHWASFMYAGAP